MKTRLIIAALLSVLCIPLAAHAESPFKAGELTIDAAAVYSDHKSKFQDSFTQGMANGQTGYSLGVAYFPKVNFGFGLDTIVRDAGHHSNGFLDSVNVSGIARLPLGHFAPSVFTGAGRNFDTGEYTAHLGAGLEWRASQRAAIFTDARYVWSPAGSKNPDDISIRAGVRFVF